MPCVGRPLPQNDEERNSITSKETTLVGLTVTLAYPLVPYGVYTRHSEPSQLARGDLGALRYAPGTVGKLTMSPFHRRIAGFVKLDTREMALVAIRRLPHCQAR